MPSIDYARVKELCPLRDVLRAMGFSLKDVGFGQYRGKCPLHQSGNPNSRSLAVNGRGWYCHLCKRGGSVLDLMMELHGTTLSGAAERLCAMMGVSVPYLGTGGGPFEPPRNGEEEPVKDRGAQRSNFAPESAAGRS